MTAKPDSLRKDDFELRWLAPCMFYLSLTFLGLLAAIMVAWIDENVVEAGVDLAAGEVVSNSASEAFAYEARAFQWGRLCGILLLLIWPIFVLEQIFHFLRARRSQSFTAKHPYSLLFCLVPPLRLCAHRRGEHEEVWMPIVGWQIVDRKLRKKLERAFSIPMIWIALLILPVLGLQFFFKDLVAEHASIRFFLHFGTGIIWFAFAVEFIVMVSVAEKRLEYCKKHWLDLAIILLPLVSFLRTLRILRAGRLLKVAKLNQLSRVVRVYRLRGVAMRGLRALMLLEILHRLLRTKPESRILKLEMQFREKELELQEIKEEIDRLKKLHDDQNS